MTATSKVWYETEHFQHTSGGTIPRARYDINQREWEHRNMARNEHKRERWLVHLALRITAQIGGSPTERERNVEAVRIAESDTKDEGLGEDFPTWFNDGYREKLIGLVAEAAS